MKVKTIFFATTETVWWLNRWPRHLLFYDIYATANRQTHEGKNKRPWRRQIRRWPISGAKILYSRFLLNFLYRWNDVRLSAESLFRKKLLDGGAENWPAGGDRVCVESVPVEHHYHSAVDGLPLLHSRAAGFWSVSKLPNDVSGRRIQMERWQVLQ